MEAAQNAIYYIYLEIQEHNGQCTGKIEEGIDRATTLK